MLFASIKAAISGILVATVSEVSRRSPAFGGLIASLPIVSVLAMIWMWVEGADEARIADHSLATFWFVLPSLPMFLILPVLVDVYPWQKRTKKFEIKVILVRKSTNLKLHESN